MGQDPTPIDFRAIFESVPGLYLILRPDADFTIVAVSDAYCEATMKPRAELLGTPLFVAFPDNPSDPAADGVFNLRASLRRVLEGRRADKMAIQKYDIPRPASRGGGFEERWWSPVNSPVLAKGRVRFIIHRVDDVTDVVRLTHRAIEQDRLYEELMRSESELKASQGKLESAIRARDELLSVCSHELRTPITSMKLQAQLAKRNLARGDPQALAPERVRKLVDQSDRQLDRLTHLIEEMLDFSRVQAGKLQLHPENFDLRTLVAEVLDRMELLIQAAQCKLTLAPMPSVIGRWDRGRLDQMITNLLGNAIKYAAGKAIRLRLEQREGVAVLAVEDEGIGIGPESLERIFEPYERAVSAANISGLGLGLYITREVVASHRGEISVRSELGKGSTFTVRLPLESASTN